MAAKKTKPKGKPAAKAPGKTTPPPSRKLVTALSAPSNRAYRVTFSYEGDKVTLVSQQRVEVILHPPHPVEGNEGQAGFWFTVHDAKNQPVYRRLMQSPIRHDVEVFSAEGDKSIHRQPFERPKGAFTILVPEIEGAQSVSISSHPLKPGAMHLPASEIGRFKIAKGK